MNHQIKNFKDHYASFLEVFNEKMKTQINPVSSKLSHAQTFALMAGGKRLRPYLIYCFSEFFQIKKSLALELGLIIEKIHCYSLIHDDLPAMDDAKLRHGQTSLHKEFDEATAILAGDAFFSDAFRELSDLDLNHEIKLKLINFLAIATGSDGLVLGQIYDLQYDGDLEAFKKLSEEDQIFYLYKTQFLKTGCLFVFCALVAGTLYDKEFLRRTIHLEGLSNQFTEYWKFHPLVQAGEKEGLDPFIQFGSLLGIIFQLVDDLLDNGDSAKTGKDTKKDLGKVTFLNLYGEKKLKETVSQMVDKAEHILETLHVPEDSPLVGLLHFIVNRDH